jgi:hypothetical protein
VCVRRVGLRRTKSAFRSRTQDFERIDVHLVALRANALLTVGEATLAARRVEVDAFTAAVAEGPQGTASNLEARHALKKAAAALADERARQAEGVTVGRLMAGARGAREVLQRRVRLQRLRVCVEASKFLVSTTDKAPLVTSIMCSDGVAFLLDAAVFQCAPGNANFDWRFACEPADGGKPVLFVGQDKHSASETNDPTVSGPELRNWYNLAEASLASVAATYDVVIVYVTNRRFTGDQAVLDACPRLLLVAADELECYLSPTFAHRGIVPDGP